MNYLSRQFVSDRLRVGLTNSYSFVAASYGKMISSDNVLTFLNKRRRGIPSALCDIPHDLVTAQELVETPELADSGLTAVKLLAMARRKRNPPPHFRYTRRIVRFPKSRFFAWLKAQFPESEA